MTGTIIASAWGNQVRDNFNLAGPGVVSAQGDLLYATGANVLARLAKGTALQRLRMNAGATAPEWASGIAATADVTTSEDTSSASFTDLATSGPAVTLSPGATMPFVLVVVSAWISNSAAADSEMSFEGKDGGGSTTVAASESNAALVRGTDRVSASRATLLTDQVSGSVYTAKYLAGGGTGTFERRRITAYAL